MFSYWSIDESWFYSHCLVIRKLTKYNCTDKNLFKPCRMSCWDVILCISDVLFCCNFLYIYTEQCKYSLYEFCIIHSHLHILSLQNELWQKSTAVIVFFSCIFNVVKLQQSFWMLSGMVLQAWFLTFCHCICNI